jgi:integral membrane sensor domain MASE1
MVMDPSTVESAAAREQPSAAQSAAADFKDMLRRAEEIGRYLRYLMSIKKERVSRSLRRTLWLVVAGVLGAVVGMAIVATAGVLVCIGIAAALNRAFESSWIGTLVTGVGILALIGGAFVLATRATEKKAAAALRHRHEVERAELKMRYGRGLDE